MDNTNRYRELIKQLLRGLAELIGRNPRAGVESLLAFDDEHGQYLLLKTGWNQNQRVKGITLHVRLRQGKIWVEEDWTEDGIATDLVKAGVPRHDIVLAFHPPDLRPMTEFAVA